ncbi:MAG: hypothetical protein AAF500_11990 [Myxococcota bacterium]
MIDVILGWANGVLGRIPPHVRRWSKGALAFAVLLAIGVVLVRQLRGLDWAVVVRSLPTSPWFYAAWLGRYLLLPVTEVLCYSAVFARNLFRDFGAFLLKRLMNASLAGGSGDTYFLVWLVEHLSLSTRQAFSAIKDVTLLSAAAANGVAVVVLGAFLVWGDWRVLTGVEEHVVALVVGVTFAAAALSVLVIAFRGKVIGVSTRTMGRIIGLHTIRSAGALVLLGLQWSAAVPEVDAATWANLLIVALLVSRTPFLPAPELLFLTIALALVGTIDAPQARLEAMFLADAALVQIFAIPSLVVALVWRRRRAPETT